jgi:DNA-binding beta-propeller fold protein YncE
VSSVLVRFHLVEASGMCKGLLLSLLSALLLIITPISNANAEPSITLGTTGVRPLAITIDSSGNVYTANYFVNNVSKITPQGVSTILATSAGGPIGITIDSSGNI